MSVETITTRRVKAHTRYKNVAGKQVPGVTTITGELGWKSNALCRWANNLGLKGIDSSKYVDEAAAIGTLAHLMVTDYLQGIKGDYAQEYSRETIDRAENSFLSFLAWEKAHRIEPILIETPLVSEEFQFGGQIDIYAKVNGALELIDLKTGGGVYREHEVQVSAYRALLAEHGYACGTVRILNIPRSNDEAFIEKVVSRVDAGWGIFIHCLAIYRLKKELGE